MEAYKQEFIDFMVESDVLKDVYKRQALIFALYHCDIVIFLNMEFSQILAEIPLFFMGLGLAYTQEKTADIVCPVLVHMIINVISLS